MPGESCPNCGHTIEDTTELEELRAEQRGLALLLIGVCGTLSRAAEQGVDNAEQMLTGVRAVIANMRKT